MNWREKILTGMRLIHEGCKENPDWINCNMCPMNEVCNSLEEDKDVEDWLLPCDWTDSMLNYQTIWLIV